MILERFVMTGTLVCAIVFLVLGARHAVAEHLRKARTRRRIEAACPAPETRFAARRWK